MIHHRKLGAIALALTLFVLPASTAQAAGEVTGKFLGNGKDGKLAFVVATPHDLWEGKKAWQLVFSEKDPTSSKKPGFDAMFGKLGHALVIAITETGDIFSTQVCHQGLEKSGLSSSGTTKVDGFKLEGGVISAHFFTEGEEEFFGDRWQFDLKVKVPLPKR